MHKTKYCAPRTLLNNGTNSYAHEKYVTHSCSTSSTNSVRLVMDLMIKGYMDIENDMILAIFCYSHTLDILNNL